MNYVGIDISKYKHDCFIMSDFGEVVNAGFTFTNNAEGFGLLQTELERCGQDNVRIGFEATGNYGINLKLFLERTSFNYMEINPLLIKEHIKGSTLRRTKTDKLDAKAIAGYMLSKEFKPHSTSFYPKFALKQLTRLRGSLVTGRSRYLVQLTNILDCIFPEFKPLFNNKFSVTALYILANYPSPEAISNMNSRSILLHNETFAAYYQKKVSEGKPHYVAISHVAKKLVRLIYTLETKGVMFDPDILR